MLLSAHQARLLWLVTKICLMLFIALVGTLILLTTFSYVPPDFRFGFLKNRESYFFSWYSIAFYIHIFASSFALFLGLPQFIHLFRTRFPKVHRWVGMTYMALVLAAVSPSGMAMAFKANGGWIAITAFVSLACLTFTSTFFGLLHIKRGRILQHQLWMNRSYILLASAVVLRFEAAVVSQLGLESWISYGAIAWLSWVPTLLVHEVIVFKLKSTPAISAFASQHSS